MKELLRGLKDRCPSSTARLRKESEKGRGLGPLSGFGFDSEIFGRGSPFPPPTPASASSPGPIRKQPSGSGNSREDPEAVSAVTRQCGNPPFALRRWRQLRRRPRARMAGGDSRGPVREGASMHARGDEARGGAELRAGGWGGAEGSLEKGAGPRRQERGGGAWPSGSRGRASGRLEVGPREGGEGPGGQGAGPLGESSGVVSEKRGLGEPREEEAGF